VHCAPYVGMKAYTGPAERSHSISTPYNLNYSIEYEVLKID
jgi:hypothetical protein